MVYNLAANLEDFQLVMASPRLAPSDPIYPQQQNQEPFQFTLDSHRDSPNLGERNEDVQPSQSPSVQQRQQHQQHNRSPNNDGQMEFSGYFDPLAADPIINTTTDIKHLFRIFATIPRFLYFSMFLFLPFFYRTRVNQIFRGVRMTENEIASRYASGLPPRSWRPKHWAEVKDSWTTFVDSVVKEWGTLNIVSVLLLS